MAHEFEYTVERRVRYNTRNECPGPVIPREELERLAHEYRLGDTDLDHVLGKAYLVGVEAYRDQILGAPSVWRVAVNGELMPLQCFSKMKRFYTRVSDARRALQFAPEGAKVQAGR